MRRRKKEKNNFLVYFVIFIAILILVVLFLASTISAVKKVAGGNKTVPIGQNSNEKIRIDIGKYNLTKINEETGDVDESYFNDLSFEFKENNKIKIYDIQGKYLEGTYKLEDENIICTAKKIYYYEYDENGKKITNSDVNINYTLKKISDRTLKINAIDYIEESEFELFNTIGNEYTFE